MKKKVLSLVLALSMALTFFPSNSFADNYEDTDAFVEDGEEEIVFLEQLTEEEEIVLLEQLAEEDDEAAGEAEDKPGNGAENQTQNGDIEPDGDEQERARWLEYIEKNNISTQDEYEWESDSYIYLPSASAQHVGENQVYAYAETVTTRRYTVLVLDDSGSMSGSPVTALKRAAIKFCDAALKANGENQVAVISYENSATIRQGFTSEGALLESAVNMIRGSGSTNTNDGFVKAQNLINSIPDGPGVIKNIVLMSDGMPNVGATASSGRYTYDDYSSYQYANAVYNTAKGLKESGNYIYSLGFFHSLSTNTLNFARRFMIDLQNAGYYEVQNPDDLEFVFGEIANEITKQSGFYYYASPVKDVNKKAKKYDDSAYYYYSDEYFYGSSFAVWDSAKMRWKYNDSLATMSLCLELSAWGSNVEKRNGGGKIDYTVKSKNAEDLLGEIGFDHLKKSPGFLIQPERDTIGAVAARKPLKVGDKEYTLIALAIRGGGYGAEWASNFTLGAEGMHQGFREARDNVMDFLRGYIRDQKITGDIKLWITGYSRAGATANLVAGALDDGAYIGDCTLLPEDLYAFCFEAPQGALKKDNVNGNPKYDNIINIINRNDVVTKVAMIVEPFSFVRYGRDVYLPSENTSSYYAVQKDNMLLQYNELKAFDEIKGKKSIYTVDDFQMKKWEIAVNLNPLSVYPVIKDDYVNYQYMGVFLDTTISTLAVEQIKNRSNYVKEYQDDIRETVTIFMGADDDQWSAFADILVDKLTTPTNLAKLLAAATTDPGEWIFGSVVEQIEEHAIESLNAAGIATYDKNQIHSMAGSLARLLVKFAVSHPNLTTTLLCNLDSIGSAHYPELCLAWMQSRDPNYTINDAWTTSSGSYRIIRINCPVDVKVYDGGGKLVAEIISDKPQTVEGSTIASAINEDGEKLVYLPPDEDYTVELTATGDGSMVFSINEFSPELGNIARLLNYYEVPLVAGATTTANIPAFEVEFFKNGIADGSSTGYRLTLEDGTEIAPDEDLTGEDAASAYYMVTVLSENEEQGMVMGQGVRQLGNFAQVEAFAFEGYVFEGWYVDGVKVSEDPEYRFMVDSDITLTARFTPRPAAITLDKSYLALKKGQSSQLKAYCNNLPESPALKESWKSSQENVATVDADGLVTAVSAGTAIITAYYEEFDIAAECRVDVTEDAVGSTVKAVNLLQNKVASNLCSIKYARIPLQLELDQNKPQVSAAYSIQASNANGNAIPHSIRSVSLANDLNGYFAARVVDDRFVELIPQTAPEAVKIKSLKTRLVVDVDGTEFTTPELTITITKEQPKLKAASIKFNSFFSDNPLPVAVSSSIGSISNIALLEKNDYDKVVFNSKKGTLQLKDKDSKPQKLVLSVLVDEFAAPFEVPLSVSATSVKPSVKLSTNSVTMIQYAPLRILGQGIEDIEVEGNSIFEATKPDSDGNFTVYYTGSDSNTVSAKLNLRVSFTGTAQSVVLPLSVKKSPAGAVKVTLSSKTVTLNKYLDGDRAVVNVTTNPPDAQMPEITGDTDKFEIEVIDNRMEISLTDRAVVGKSYKLKVANATLTVKVADKYPTIKLSAKGTLDVINPSSSITLTPRFTNYNYHAGAAVTVDNPIFEVVNVNQNGVVTLRLKEVLDGEFIPRIKQSVTLTYSDERGQWRSSPVNITPKQTKVKLYQNTKQISLQKNDVYSEGQLDISVISPSAARITDVRIRGTNEYLYSIRRIQNGSYVIGYKDHQIGKVSNKTNLTLDIYLAGSNTPVSTTVKLVNT